MSMLVGGSVALDTIETPVGRADRVLGGSASYVAYAASFLTDVSLVGIIGEDFPEEYREVLEARKIDLSGLEVSSQPTFNWHGRYHEDINQRDTLSVDLSIFEDYTVTVPDHLKESSVVCLANMSPENQLQLLEACHQPRFVLADTMNLWIEIARDPLLELLTKIDLLILNDSEAKMLTEEDNLIKAGRKLLGLGPRYVCIKKGEHGVSLFDKENYFVLGAYPLDSVLDPTGAGDCFAGGLAGYLDQVGTVNFSSLKRSLIAATTAASFCVEDFSFHKLQKTTDQEFQERQNHFVSYVSFDESAHEAS